MRVFLSLVVAMVGFVVLLMAVWFTTLLSMSVGLNGQGGILTVVILVGLQIGMFVGAAELTAAAGRRFTWMVKEAFAPAPEPTQWESRAAMVGVVIAMFLSRILTVRLEVPPILPSEDARAFFWLAGPVFAWIGAFCVQRFGRRAQPEIEASGPGT